MSQKRTGDVNEVLSHGHAWLLGARWACDHPGHTLGEALQAAMVEARRHPWDASHMTEFGQGATTVRDGAAECIERYTREADNGE